MFRVEGTGLIRRIGGLLLIEILVDIVELAVQVEDVIESGGEVLGHGPRGNC